MHNTFSFITGDTIQEIIVNNYDKVRRTIQHAYLSHEEGKTVNPNSYFLRFPDKPSSRIIALPAAIADDRPIAGIKWIASNPKNIEKNLPRASSVIILNDYETGRPTVCLEGSIISATRTAFSAVMAADHIRSHHKNLKSLAIIGTGPIAATLYNAFNANDWKIEQLKLFDLKRSHAEKFCNKYVISQQHDQVDIQDNLESTIKQAELIVFTTTAAKPYVTDPKWFSHKPTVLNISLRDLAPEILLNANNIVDDVQHVLNANTSPDLTYQASGNSDFINGTLAQLIKSEIKLDANKPTIFSPMGLGVLDLALARMIYTQAKMKEAVRCIDNYFPA